MFSFKRILNIASCFLLLLSLVSASGFTSTSTNYESPKTELVSKNTPIESTSFVKYYSFAKTYQTLIFNPFIVFNFKCLLKIHSFDFSITLKSQKETTLQSLEYPFLEQNLIAQINMSKYQKITS
ncbi:hypothetical protein [uncultured Algibacter sp.]|uniref:hypothetical protein n=1 Tax=uncultured Algibacter sp. TaxID=298659 RepID=UPI00262B1979|nr:hypothetical protein [uncultured Algibacter sp.]